MIDDEKDFGKMLKLSLERYGLYEVDLATDGSDGLKKVEGDPYDVIILDVLMPQMEGHEVLSRIKTKVQTPVIILSAYLPPPMESEILRRGAFACLHKPIELDQLIVAIHRALSEPIKKNC